MSSNPITRYLTVAALSVSLPFSTGCANKADSNVRAAGAGAPPAMPVAMIVAQPTSINETSEYVATLKSRNSTTISPQVDGQITHIYVKSGDKVAAGDALMQIDPLKQQATVGSQEASRAAKFASLRYAEQQLQRTKNLYAAGVVSKQALDQDQSAYDASSAEVKSLEAQVNQEQVQLHYYRVTAPTEGIVGDIPVHVGDRISQTSVLTTIDKSGMLEAYIDVPVERGSDLSLGKAVQIIDASGHVLADSRISFISSQISDATQSVLVKAQIGDAKTRLRTEQFVRARIVWGTRSAVTAPVLAISRINGQFFAFVAEGKDEKSLVAKQRQIKLGDIVGNDYIVLDGIRAGDRIIVSGTQFLSDGAPVTARS